MSEINEQISELMQSGELPTRIEIPAPEVPANPNILEPGRLPFIIELAQLGQLVRMRKILEESARRRFFEGELDPLFLNANSSQQYAQPSPPWVSVFIINGGPNTAFIAVNNLHKQIQMLAGETRTIDHRDADRRIERLYYWCAVGEWSDLRVEGHY